MDVSASCLSDLEQLSFSCGGVAQEEFREWKLLDRRREKNSDGSVSKFVNGYRMIMQNGHVRNIGQGAFGKVKLGVDCKTENFKALKKMKVFALKKIREHKMSRQGMRIITGVDKVQNEIAILKVLQHPNIIRMCGLVDDPACIYIVFDYADGGQILHFNADALAYESKTYPEKLPELVAKRAFSDLVCGVAYLHSVGVVHRDIKPENLLLDKKGRLLICDFGVARKFFEGESAIMTETQGTYSYFSPEMCDGNCFSPFPADVWAAGVCLYVFLFGTVPFLHKDPNQLFAAIKSDPYKLPLPISEAYESLLSNLLTKNPATRLTAEQLLTLPFLSGVMDRVSLLAIPSEKFKLPPIPEPDDEDLPPLP